MSMKLVPKGNIDRVNLAPTGIVVRKTADTWC